LDYLKVIINKDDLELFNSNLLKERISKFITKQNNIEFDLSNIESISSSGLGILISCLKLVKDKGLSLKLSNINSKIQNIFEITKLNLIFEIEK
jgi:anti-sigma B factor antagonist